MTTAETVLWYADKGVIAIAVIVGVIVGIMGLTFAAALVGEALGIERFKSRER